MDRRKLKSNTLFRRNPGPSASPSYSILPLDIERTTKDQAIARSASAGNPSVPSQIKHKKRKNIMSDDEDEENIPARSPSPERMSSSKKRKDNNEKSDKDPNSESEREVPKKASKTTLASKLKKRSRGSDNSDDDNVSNISRASNIKDMLAELDKTSNSPPKNVMNFSQSSFKEPVKNFRRRCNYRPPAEERAASQRWQSQGTSSQSENPTRMSQTTSQESVKVDEKSRKGIQEKDSSENNSTAEPEKTPLKNRLSMMKQKKSSLKNVLSELTPKKQNDEKNPSQRSEVERNEYPASEDMFSDVEKSPTRSSNLFKNKNEQMTSNKTPEKQEKRDRSLSPELNLSPIRDLSPAKNVTQRKNKKSKTDKIDTLTHFLNISGIYLSNSDAFHNASADQPELVKRMKNFINEKEIDKDELLQNWNSYIQNQDNLRKSLEELKVESDDGVQLRSKASTLAKVLMHVPQLQNGIIDSLFKKLIDAVLTTESSDDVPWAHQMLQQFRFMEIVIDPEFLINKVEELLQASPEWFQREIIVFLPDIVDDTQHQTTAEILVNLMERNKDLTNIILDCIYSLMLSKDYREDLRTKVLSMVNNEMDKNNIPSVTRFILNDCSSDEVALKSLNVLRKLDLIPGSEDKIEDCYTQQECIINDIKMALVLSKEVAQASLALIKNADSHSKPAPLDLILMFLVYETTASRQKVVETTLLNHIKEGYYTVELLKNFYKGYQQVARNFQPTALTLAINLLKADNNSHIEFGIEWIRNLFAVQFKTSYKQREIMEKLLLLMGNKDKTVKNALEILCRMADDKEERKYFERLASYLRLMLEKIDNLPFEEVTTLYHVLHGLCTTSQSISDVLNDDLAIIMQKQLFSSNIMTKCKGVLGATMAIKHLAEKSETCKLALDIFNKVQNSVSVCYRSQGLFYDKLGQVLIVSKKIDGTFLNEINEVFEEEFINNSLVPVNKQKDAGNLISKFGLNTEGENEWSINFREGNNALLVPALFKLLRICTLRKNGNLESINAILGYPVQMPEDLEMPEPSIADAIIHCINWFREIIGGFVTQEAPLLREYVINRLGTLMKLQGDLVNIISMCDNRYQPSPAYFHYFPSPPFVRVDKKIGKKRGRKASNKEDKNSSTQSTKTIMNKPSPLPEWEAWELGSQLTVKNAAYFRQFDAKIVNLLEFNMNMDLTQSTSQKISIAQVCFIIKELLGMFENQVSENFIKDLVQLLPKICTKLWEIVEDLRKNDSKHEQEAVRLLLCLLTTIFSWKEFHNSANMSLLRDGLRHLASLNNKENQKLRSCKDLVSEAYSYFESLADIATQISLAIALVNTCACLMKHSKTFLENCRERQAKLAYGFLGLEWDDDCNSNQYKSAIKDLLQSWMENEPDQLNTVTEVLNWLPGEVEILDRPQSHLQTLPSVTRRNLHLLMKQIWVGLLKGMEISLAEADRDPQRIQIWFDAAQALDNISGICRTNKSNPILTLYMRYSSMLFNTLNNKGMKVLELNMKYQIEDVLSVLKLFQKAGRFLRDIFCTARKDKNIVLLKLIPLVKSKREQFLYNVKGLMALNSSLSAFWMGALLNKDMDGENIQTEEAEELSTELLSESNNTINDAPSEVYNSDASTDAEEDDD